MTRVPRVLFHRLGLGWTVKKLVLYSVLDTRLLFRSLGRFILPFSSRGGEGELGHDQLRLAEEEKGS